MRLRWINEFFPRMLSYCWSVVSLQALIDSIRGQSPMTREKDEYQCAGCGNRSTLKS